MTRAAEGDFFHGLDHVRASCVAMSLTAEPTLVGERFHLRLSEH